MTPDKFLVDAQQTAIDEAEARPLPPARGRCQRCGNGADDLWIARLDGKIALLCPACFADRRLQGRDVSILKESS